MRRFALLPGNRKHSRLFAAALFLGLIIVLAACGTSGPASRVTTPHPTPSPTSGAQVSCSTAQQGQWTPVGVTWKLTVSFVDGARKGQSEQSIMTFLPSGQLTATFPGPTPASPPTLPPAVDGRWCVTGSNTFAYTFKDPIMQNGVMVAYVQPAINAKMMSAKEYIGDGVGVAYSAMTGMPLGQYGVTHTVAYS
jgi:hypothetical protein